MKVRVLLILHIFFVAASLPSHAKKNIQEREIVIVTASYNNSKWHKRNLHSVFMQNYSNYSLIYVDDCSPDGTYDLVKSYIKKYGQEHRVVLIGNQDRKKALANLYTAIHMCNNEAIVVILDGDDFLAHENVLSYINEVYSDPNIWLTYGQFKEYPDGNIGFCAPFPDNVVQNNSFRDYLSAPSHLRTFYAGLFKRISMQDLMYKGDFFPMTYDLAIMFPMIEMARDHFTFIPEVLLDYNTINPINDHKVSKDLQQKIDVIIRNQLRYKKIYNPFEKTYEATESIRYKKSQERYNIGLLIIATGEKKEYVTSLIESAKKYFCTDHAITYFVFTDDNEVIQGENIVKIPQRELSHRCDKLLPCAIYSLHAAKFEDMDYLFACDPNMKFINRVDDEILSDRVGTLHAAFLNKIGFFERNKESTACVKPEESVLYYTANFYGGKKRDFLTMVHTIRHNIMKDNKNRIIAIKRNESHLNRYFIDNPPTKVLPPSYAHPQDAELGYFKRFVVIN